MHHGDFTRRLDDLPVLDCAGAWACVVGVILLIFLAKPDSGSPSLLWAGTPPAIIPSPSAAPVVPSVFNSSLRVTR
jgi:hypothetical protein